MYWYLLVTALFVVYIIVQLLKGKCYSTASLEGKTIIVTGANTGIGFETALDFAGRKGRVILACRNKERGETAQKKIIELTGNSNVVVKLIDLSSMSSVRKFVDEFVREEKQLDILVNNAAVTDHHLLSTKRKGRVILACRNKERGETAQKKIIELTGNSNVVVKLIDLSSMSSVRKFVDEFVREEKQLDILVNNAAVTGLTKTMTDEGLEYSHATNYFGPFLLTNLLLDMLKKSPGSRIVNVSSIVNMFGKADCENLNGERYNIALMYYNTKLLNILFTKELARRLEGTGVTTYCLHPGSVRTELLRNIPVYIRVPMQLLGLLFFKTCKEGAQTTIYCAVSEDVKGESGKYYMDCKDYEHTIYISKQAYDEGLCKKVWEITERFTKLQQ